MPGRFVRSGKKQRAKAKQLLRSRDLMTLLSVVPEPYLHTLTAKDLGISKEQAKPSGLYEPDTVQVWRDVIAQTFSGCAFYVLQSGSGDCYSPKRGNIHTHVLAASTDGLGETFKGTEKCKPVDDLKGLLRYLHKPSEAYSLEAVLDWQVSRLKSKGNEAPRLRGWLTSQKRQAWSIANALRPLN
jgi:hypothetical protein